MAQGRDPQQAQAPPKIGSAGVLGHAVRAVPPAAATLEARWRDA
jgi:hypothetical protein